MDKKRIFLITIIAVMGIFLVLTISYIYTPLKTNDLVLQISNRAKNLTFRFNIQPEDSTWKKYIDEKHGFSLRYPAEWANVSGKEVDESSGEPSGISITTNDVENCTTADNYLKAEILPYYGTIKVVPIPNPRLNGFVVEKLHLDNITPGPEAYIMNCPYVIRLGFNPTGINAEGKMFDGIISRFETWKPSE